MSTVNETQYLKKSIKIFRFYAIGLLVSIITIIFFKPLKENYSFLFDTLVGLPIYITLFLAPRGLYYNWKSYKAKEEPRKKRTLFFMGHLFFCTLIMLLIMSVIKDLSSLNW